jgi:hypothetical protein
VREQHSAELEVEKLHVVGAGAALIPPPVSPSVLASIASILSVVHADLLERKVAENGAGACSHATLQRG